jgi:hypothetical protein
MEKLELLLSAWRNAIGDKWTTAGDLLKTAGEHSSNALIQRPRESLLEALVEVDPNGRSGGNPNKIGCYLRRFAGRISGGYKLEQKPRTSVNSRHAQQYRVKLLGQSEDAS